MARSRNHCCQGHATMYIAVSHVINTNALPQKHGSAFSVLFHYTHRCQQYETSFGPHRGRDSSVGIATLYGMDGPGIELRREAIFPAPNQTRPEANIASRIMSTGSFPGVKRPGRGVNHAPSSSAEVKERVELQPYSPYGPSRQVTGRSLPLPKAIIFCPILTKPGVWQIFVKVLQMKFHEIVSSGSCADTCRRTDRHNKAISRFCQLTCKRLKSWPPNWGFYISILLKTTHNTHVGPHVTCPIFFSPQF